MNYSAWHNSPAAPYSNQIASQCASAGNFLAVTHPSQPNYLSAADGQFHPWSGSAKVTTNDNLYHQLDGTGVPYLIPDLAGASSVSSREPTSIIRVLLQRLSTAVADHDSFDRLGV